MKVYQAKDPDSVSLDKVEEDGFELRKNGEFIKYSVDFSGTQMQTVGHFKVKGNTVYVYFDDPYLDSVFNIVSLDEETLKIR